MIGGVRCLLRRRHDRDDGYSVVETVITIPVLIFLVMTVAQYALVWHGRHVAQMSAQNGLRAARSYLATSAAGQTAATSYLSSVAPTLLTNSNVQVTRTATTVTVRVQARVVSAIPMASFSVDEQASGPTERYIGSPG